MFTRRSRNSYMRALRSVTFTPSGMSSRTLKPAIDLRAWVMTGFWPAIFSRSAAADFTFLVSLTASPTPMFSTILSSLGSLHDVLVAELLDELGMMVSS